MIKGALPPHTIAPRLTDASATRAQDVALCTVVNPTEAQLEQYVFAKYVINATGMIFDKPSPLVLISWVCGTTQHLSKADAFSGFVV
jgi:hypothetical protein